MSRHVLVRRSPEQERIRPSQQLPGIVKELFVNHNPIQYSIRCFEKAIQGSHIRNNHSAHYFLRHAISRLNLLPGKVTVLQVR